MALFAEGKLFREAGTGSGGGDKHNKGYFVDESALTTAYPTAEAGDYAIVESTDTVWIWDSDNSEWKDSDQKGQVTSVNGQTGDVVLDLLPSQTGNAGKFLITNGTDASWSDKPLVNKATNINSSVAILGAATSGNAIVIGNGSSSNSYQTIALGVGAVANYPYSLAVGNLATPRAYGAVQFGNGSNSDAGTVNFSLTPSEGVWNNYRLLNADGTIPEARLADTTNAQQGDVLTLDSTGNAVWQAGGGIQNTATGNQSVTLLGTPTNQNYAMNIGLSSIANGSFSFAVGRYANADGMKTYVIGSGTAYGDYDLVVGTGNIARGCHGSVVIGVTHSNLTPVQESNVAVFMLNDHNYKILDSDGSIPTDRLIKNSIPHYTTMPAATPDLSGTIAQYVGTTDSSYTNGYFYKCSQGTSSATASQTTGSSLSDVSVAVATFETRATDNGSYVFRYSSGDSAWIHNYLITDLANWGITYTGTPVNGDVITVVYDNGLGWAQVDVQPSSVPTDPAFNSITLSGTTSYRIAAASSYYLRIGTGTTASNYDLFIKTGSGSSATMNIAFGMAGGEVGAGTAKMGRVYTTKINNGADIAVPTTGGTMAVQVSSLPTASSTLEGQIYQFVGTTDQAYTNGHFYKCVSDGADPVTYSWEEVSFGGGSSYTAGTGIDITNDVISVADPVLVNKGTASGNLNIFGDTGLPQIRTEATSIGYYAAAKGNYSMAVGVYSASEAEYGLAIGYSAYSGGECSSAIGAYAQVLPNVTHAIQIGCINPGSPTNNPDSNTFKVANANGNFELMNANGNLPADRLASTTGLADGNYRLRLVMASGVPTLEWVAE